jgi:putative transposase
VARLTRLALAGELHLLALAGHNGAPVFADDEDRQAFSAMLRQSAADHGVSVHAWVQLDAQVRLLATPARAEGLGRLVQALGRRYVPAFNRRHGRSGTLWEGRFRSCVIDPPAWLLAATVHLESLPVAGGLAAAPADWRWSSAMHHVGAVRDPMVIEHPDYWRLGNTPFDRELAHARLLEQGIPSVQAEALDAALQRGHALGDGAFLARLADLTPRPLLARPRGRPRRPQD